jgi:hypothetical protein
MMLPCAKQASCRDVVESRPAWPGRSFRHLPLSLPPSRKARSAHPDLSRSAVEVGAIHSRREGPGSARTLADRGDEAGGRVMVCFVRKSSGGKSYFALPLSLSSSRMRGSAYPGSFPFGGGGGRHLLPAGRAPVLLATLADRGDGVLVERAAHGIAFVPRGALVASRV